MTVTPTKDYLLYRSKHLAIETNFPERFGKYPPWFSFGIHLDFQKLHCVAFFWKYMITFGWKIDWGYIK